MGNPIAGTSGNDTLLSTDAGDDLDGGEGVDALSYASSTNGISINVLVGTASGGFAAGDTFANFEAYIGSNHADTITGGWWGDVISAGAGNDSIFGGLGDTIDGGEGNDRLYISTIQSFDNGATKTQVDGGAGDDSYYLEGTKIYLTDQSGVSVVYIGNLTQSSIILFNYRSSIVYNLDNVGNGISIDMSIYADSRGNFIGGMSNITGTSANDTILGDDDSLNISGGAGNDLIVGGSGEDVLNGGAGADTLDGDISDFDTARYTESTAGIALDFIAGENHGGDAEGDVIRNIERIIGTSFSDLFRTGDRRIAIIAGEGDDMAFDIGNLNVVRGGGGADILNTTATSKEHLWIYGESGNDIIAVGNSHYGHIRGDEGDDRIGVIGVSNSDIQGGAGNDTLSFMDESSELKLGSIDGISFSLMQTSDSWGNTYGGFENLIGSEGDDTLWGAEDSNVVDGAVGRDLIFGGFGNDTLVGGAGQDTLFGGDGDDTARFEGNVADYTMEYSQNGDMWVVTNKNNGVAAEGTDYLLLMEQISFADFTVDVVSDTGSAVMTLHKNLGGHNRKEFDKAGVQAWTQYENTYDANSQLKSQVGSYRNGGSWLAEWDVDGGHSWSSYTGNYNAQGQQTMQVGNYDDGRHWVGTWDTGNSNNWTNYNNNYTSDWRLYEQVGNYDNGNKWVAEWDLGNVQAWSARTTNYDAQDRALLQVTSNDNGTFSVTTWDVANAEAWAYRVQNYDAVWGLTGATLIPD